MNVKLPPSMLSHGRHRPKAVTWEARLLKQHNVKLMGIAKVKDVGSTPRQRGNIKSAHPHEVLPRHGEALFPPFSGSSKPR